MFTLGCNGPIWLNQRVAHWRRGPVWPRDADYVTYDPSLKATGQKNYGGGDVLYAVTGASSCQWMIPGTNMEAG